MQTALAGDEPAALAAMRRHIEAGWHELQQDLDQAGATVSPARSTSEKLSSV